LVCKTFTFNTLFCSAAGLQVFSSSAGLLVVPDRSQFFRYDSFTLSCEARLNSTGWRVKRRTEGGGVRPCTSGWGTASSGSTCAIGDTYPSDSGEYWCESGSGDRSADVTVVITGTGAAAGGCPSEAGP